MRSTLLLICLLFYAAPLWAEPKRVTLYLDGARVEQELAAMNGYLELPLPDSLQQGSLRVKPVGGGTVRRVEFSQTGKGQHRQGELARLEERRITLLDRMQGLNDREEIFSAAAKSHSSRAPRKSKNNPDPVSAMRQGSEYAFTQLEQVYRAKRKCRSALDQVEKEIAALKRTSPVVRVWLNGKKVRLSYLKSGGGWTPCLAFRLAAEGEGELLVHARLPAREKGVQFLVSAGTVAAGGPVTKATDDYPLISRQPLALEHVSYREAPHPSLSFAFKDALPLLPPGEASGYWRGEYLGTVNYQGGSSGELAFGGGR